MSYWVFRQKMGEDGGALESVYTTLTLAKQFCENMQENIPIPHNMYYVVQVVDNMPVMMHTLFLGDWHDMQVSQPLRDTLNPVQ